MKQTEKLDLILKKLYEHKFDGKDYSIKEILLEMGISATREEIYALTSRLDSEGFVEMTSTKDSITAEITSYGAEYCEGDSFSIQGSAIINNNYELRIENSPGANIITNSSNISIKTNINDVKNILNKIAEAIEKEENLSQERLFEIRELLQEIDNNLNAGKIPKFGIKNLIQIIGDLSSIGSLILSLSSFI
jgi:hypothetical protein